MHILVEIDSSFTSSVVEIIQQFSIQDRWLECDLDKAQLLDGFVGFGGGRYQCPGRWFALMEMQLFVAMLLQQFNLDLLDPLPPPVSYIA